VLCAIIPDQRYPVYESVKGFFRDSLQKMEFGNAVKKILLFPMKRKSKSEKK